MEWQPIETAPETGYMLVHEDGAIRALMRINGKWKNTCYPAVIVPPWNDALVGDDALRLLPAGASLIVRDGCCESPTHWMPLPEPPK